jgi:hypothetical protein
MAVYEPTSNFEGSDLSSSSAYGRTIKEGVRVVDFKSQKNPEGTYFFILPPYKLDSNGRAVSWKTYEIRDNFGMDSKIKLSSQVGCPVVYFSSQVKAHFPNLAKIEDVTDPMSGQSRKRYPFFGRIQKRVLFNAAFTSDLTLGAHVLDVPVHNCGSKIDEWQRGRFADGQHHPPINHPKAAWPVLFKLAPGSGGKSNPWTVSVSEQRFYELPTELSDWEYLYNLDDVILYPEKEWLVEQLRTMYAADVFDKCMAGYFNTTVAVPRSIPTPSQIQPINPVMPTIPQPVQQPVVQAIPSAPAEPEPVERIQAEHASNPMAALGMPKPSFPRATVGAPPTPPQPVNTAAAPLTADAVRQLLLNQKR